MDHTPDIMSRGRPQTQKRPAAHVRTGSYPLRKSSLSSESSISSQVTTFSTTPKQSHSNNTTTSDSTIRHPNNAGHSTPVQYAPSRTAQREMPLRTPGSNTTSPPTVGIRERRQHSQGFFEPSLATASHKESSGMSQKTASQIAAQAAMHVQNPRHDRKRSITVDPSLQARPGLGPRKPSVPTPIFTAQPSSSSSASQSRNNSAGAESTAATAANAAFPRSPLASPHLFQVSDSRPQSPVVSAEAKAGGKEKSSRRKLFSKPNKITVSKDRELDKTAAKTAGIYGSSNRPAFNQSTASLADSVAPVPSLYSNVNASTSTLVPSDRGIILEKEKDKHRHHFLSRQKNKLKDDHHNLALSSASSNSRPTDLNAPQPLYSFAPSSPGLVNKSISGLDLRHGGRALREKKKEEKAQASSFVPPVPTAPRLSLDDPPDPTSALGPASTSSTLPFPSDLTGLSQGLTGFGLQNMGVDDAWPLLKARLLNIFEGEDIRTPVEDFNRLVNVHLQRCIARRSPGAMVEDVRELMRTGFLSLDHTLRHVPDERIVPHLVETWTFVFCTVVPFMQAAFLPLDLEFKGHGTLLPNPTEAADFWGAVAASTAGGKASSNIDASRPGTSAGTAAAPPPPSGARPQSNLSIRTLVLHTFRSTIILPRHDTLLAIFSRLSLDSINALPPPTTFSTTGEFPSPPSLHPARPGTAASGSLDPGSYNSQGSTLLDSSTAGSLGARSRATSNTSAGSFPSIGGRSRAGTSAATPFAPGMGSGSGNASGFGGGVASLTIDSAMVTETAARMLQCVSVLARLDGVGDEEEVGRADRVRMEGLAKELKLNWLGRSRTGRRRQGFVGSKVRLPGGGVGGGVGVGVGVPGGGVGGGIGVGA